MADDQYMFQQLYVAYQETGDKIYRFAAEEIMRLRAENEKLREDNEKLRREAAIRESGE